MYLRRRRAIHHRRQQHVVRLRETTRRPRPLDQHHHSHTSKHHQRHGLLIVPHGQFWQLPQTRSRYRRGCGRPTGSHCSGRDSMGVLRENAEKKSVEYGCCCSSPVHWGVAAHDEGRLVSDSSTTSRSCTSRAGATQSSSPGAAGDSTDVKSVDCVMSVIVINMCHC